MYDDTVVQDFPQLLLLLIPNKHKYRISYVKKYTQILTIIKKC